MRGFVFFCIFASALITMPVFTQEAAQIKGPKGADYGMQGRTIGPIKPSDTLWRIAKKVRNDESVTIYQVMSAFYTKNPDAFLDKNLNHMRDGAYLRIPTLGEMRKENPVFAKQKSDQDDALWEMKKNGMLDNGTIEQAQKKVTQARKVDVEEAKVELANRLKSLQMDQDSKLLELQNQFKSSVRNVEDILKENNKLKQKLGDISDELKNVQQQLGQDSQIQQQLKSLIDLQNELLAEQAVQKQQDSGMSGESLMSNPFMLLLMSILPALLAIGGVVFFLKKRNKDEATDGSGEDDFLPQAPVAADPLDLDIAPAAAPEPIDEGVQLDDDMLPEDDDIMFDSLENDAFEEGNDTLDQDELDGLLSDDIVFDDENDGLDSGDDLDDFLQQNFDEPDGLGDEVALDIEQDSGDILNDGDIDDLFNEVSSVDDSNDDELDISDDALAALSEELAEDSQEDVDIDSILDETSSEPDVDSLLESNGQETVESSDNLDLDDIDSLLDEAGSSDAKSEVEDFDIDDIDGLIDEAGSEEEVLSSEDEFDIDDIDGLIDEAGSEEEALSSEDEFDIDDIEGLIDEAGSEEEALSSEDEFDIDDIDGLIDEAGSEEEALSSEDEFDIDDIDGLIDEAAPQAQASSLEEELDSDDIDGLIDEAAPQVQGSSLAEEFDVDDIDGLIDEAGSEEEALSSENEFDIDDIDGLLDQAELEMEAPSLEEEFETDNINDLVEEADELGALVDED
ncbi:FimV/HubP family polar landmark protein, partial [Pseudoalteromonas aurantia]